jgi:hypothetical protein
MKLKSLAILYGLGVGVVMILFWIFFLGAGLVPELKTRPIEMIIVLIAELFTAGTLILSGILFRWNRNEGYPVFMIGLGTLMYSVINNLGYSLQNGDLFTAGLMVVFIVVNLLFFVIGIRDPQQFVPYHSNKQ